MVTEVTQKLIRRCASFVRGGKKEEWSSRRARVWSNRELRRFARLFTGDVINVSAWRDQDKEGRCYREYFKNAASYSISNFEGGWRAEKEQVICDRYYSIDLEAPLPSDLKGAFDVVFNHTTLEHIFHFTKAFENLCTMSRDVVLLVVPFIQHLHGPEDGDFWRPTPYCLRRLFAENNYTVLYESANAPDDTVYLFFIASRQPNNWLGTIPFARLSDPELGRCLMWR